MFTIEDLMSRTPYGYDTLKRIKEGKVPANPLFREKCAKALRMPQDMLFQTTEDTNGKH